MKHVKMVSCWEMDGYVNNSKFSYLSFGQALCGAYAPAPIAQADCQYVSMVSFENDSFECYYSLNGSHTEYGLFADPIHFNPYVAAHEGLVIRDCKFWGDYDHCVHIETPNYLHIDGTGLSEFVGNFNQAIYLIYGNATNQYIQNQYIHNTSTNNTGGGIYVKQGVKTNIEDCSISNVVSGIEFYNNSSIGAGNMSHIFNNDIDDCTYGISIASDLAEWTPSPCPACTTNTTANTIQLDMYCNKITNCDYGIIGIGPIVDQGTSAGGGGNLQDWSNRFCTNFSSHTCNAGSSSAYADVAWWNGSNGSLFKIYADAGSGNRSFKSMTTDVYISSNRVHSGNYALQYNLGTPGVGQSIDYYCSGNTYNINKEETNIQNTTVNKNDIRIYPNPASENFVIEQMEDLTNSNLQIQIVDQTGRPVLKSMSQSVQTTINIASLAEGIYTLRIIDLKSGKQVVYKISIIH